MTVRVVLLGDGESPHLLKWARALVTRTDLYVASSGGFSPALADEIAPSRRLALHGPRNFAGGNAGLLRKLPALAHWLRGVRPDWINAHYLTSHGTLAWASRALGVRARLAASAWGSDILVTPQRSATLRWVTERVLRAAEVATSDSRHMAERMREMGAREVMTFPFGLDALPPAAAPGTKDPDLFFANRGLEPIYRPDAVLRAFATIAQSRPHARLVMANDGSLRHALGLLADGLGLADRVRFTGRLPADEQAAWYDRARWYLSLPQSDSVAVSVLEAMAHGCVPILSDLPANRELVDDGRNGLVLRGTEGAPSAARLRALEDRADAVAHANRDWVAANALFGPSIDAFVARLARPASR